MRVVEVTSGICAIVLWVCASALWSQTAQTTKVTKTTPLILAKDEGERRVWRGFPGHPEPGSTFLLKVDPKNAGSSHLVFGTEDMPPGDKIDKHRHPGADEILFLQNGTARVHLGDTEKEVQGNTTVFIPADTWISVDNTGGEVIHLTFVFSAPGFEEFMREASAREGEKNVPLTKAEEEALEKKHAHAVIYQ